MYDYEMKNFILKNKDSDFITLMDNLILSSRRFLWSFDILKERKENLLGYTLSKSGDRYVLNICYSDRNFEFRQSWVNALGKLINKEYDFSEPIFVSYQDVTEEITSMSFENEVL